MQIKTWEKAKYPFMDTAGSQLQQWTASKKILWYDQILQQSEHWKMLTGGMEGEVHKH